VVGGLLTGSLALLADAGHMLTDVGGLALSLMAMTFAARPPTPQRTYGHHRVEILAAVVNAVVLLAVSAFVLIEAYRRFRTPPPVSSGWMLVVAIVGLAVNVLSMFILREPSSGSLNARAAYLEVVADMMGSLGVIAAALVIGWTGWLYADPLVSAALGLFIVPRTWRLLTEAVGVLLEESPRGIDLDALRDALIRLPGVTEVHDLHVWSLTAGMPSLSAHVVVDEVDHDDLLVRVRALLSERFRIGHTTIQIERTGCGGHDLHR
jgi:cobalt-zinc-cadmium efflux system protein